MEKREMTILLSGVALAVIAGGLTFYLQHRESNTNQNDEAGQNTEIVNQETQSKDDTSNENNEKDEDIEIKEEEAQQKDSDFSQTEAPKSGDLIAEIETTLGIIKLRLFKEKAPKTVENFQLLADEGYYDGIIFHRVINDFMIQTGDPTGTGMGGESAWGGKFEDEISIDLSHLKGAVSMANAGYGTNGSQFFIVQKNGGTEWLDGHVNDRIKDCRQQHISCHSVFGQVFEGMDIVDKIASVEVGIGDKPIEEVSMLSVRVYEM